MARDGYDKWLESIDRYLDDTSIDKQFLFKKIEEGEAKVCCILYIYMCV
jgi:hypothetical protein